jgi:hypothetical protein
MEKKKEYRARNIILKHNHNGNDKKSKTPMGRPRLEESK